jgi:hypothetical protein
MLAEHLFMWPLIVAAGGAVIVAIRGVVLLVGLRWALRNGRKADTAAIFGEFARAMGAKGPLLGLSGRPESRKGLLGQGGERPHADEGE